MEKISWGKVGEVALKVLVVGAVIVGSQYLRGLDVDKFLKDLTSDKKVK